jgi:glycosyltransferase involved in cell wall biosynthesis
MTNGCFEGRLGIVQRVLPSYRASFFELLTDSCRGGLSLFAGQPRADESIASARNLRGASLFQARNLHFLSPSNPYYFCYQGGLRAWLEEWKPDALIVEANFRYISSPAAVRWMRSLGRPVLGWGLGAPRSGGFFGRMRDRFLGQFDGLLAYSARGAGQYASLGLPSDRIFVAPNAVAPAPGHPLPVRADDYGGAPSLLFVGRLQARKRLPSLLRACASLPPALKPRLVIVGDGPESASLRELAGEIYPAAEFVGPKHGADLDPFFRAADLFVLPGTGGLAVQQAMSYGLPVIVAQGDGTQEDLVRPANGWQIPANDDAALLDRLRAALEDLPRLRRMGAESYRIVAQEINLERMVAAFVDALNLVSSHPVPSSKN